MAGETEVTSSFCYYFSWLPQMHNIVLTTSSPDPAHQRHFEVMGEPIRGRAWFVPVVLQIAIG
jgi:hypothetical protein